MEPVARQGRKESDSALMAAALALVLLLPSASADAVGTRTNESGLSYTVPRKLHANGEFEVFLKHDGNGKRVSSLPFDRFYRE